MFGGGGGSRWSQRQEKTAGSDFCYSCLLKSCGSKASLRCHTVKKKKKRNEGRLLAEKLTSRRPASPQHTPQPSHVLFIPVSTLCQLSCLCHFLLLPFFRVPFPLFIPLHCYHESPVLLLAKKRLTITNIPNICIFSLSRLMLNHTKFHPSGNRRENVQRRPKASLKLQIQKN